MSKGRFRENTDEDRIKNKTKFDKKLHL